MQWEYAIRTLDKKSWAEEEEALNRWGAEGWEAYFVKTEAFEEAGGDQTCYWLKRPRA